MRLVAPQRPAPADANLVVQETDVEEIDAEEIDAEEIELAVLAETQFAQIGLAQTELAAVLALLPSVVETVLLLTATTLAKIPRGSERSERCPALARRIHRLPRGCTIATSSQEVIPPLVAQELQGEYRFGQPLASYPCPGRSGAEVVALANDNTREPDEAD